MHQIAILALHGVVPFDLATPCELFGRVCSTTGAAAYGVRVCGEAPQVKAGLFDLRVPWGLDALALADTVIVPGTADPLLPVSDEVLDALKAAAERGARIASICSGAFVLAAAGLLDGQRATTHWLAAPELARRYPAIEVDANVLYVDNGQVLTSAGASAGLDLCLYMVRRDWGAAVAAEAARLAVMPLEREGGQAQFIVHAPPSSQASLGPLMAWMEQHLHQPLTLEDMACEAATSTRTLSRRFLEQTGTTPLQWLLTARVRRAQQLLESTDGSVEQIATRTGFASSAALRQRFLHTLGMGPQQYRRGWRASQAPAPPTA